MSSPKLSRRKKKVKKTSPLPRRINPRNGWRLHFHQTEPAWCSFALMRAPDLTCIFRHGAGEPGVSLFPLRPSIRAPMREGLLTPEMGVTCSSAQIVRAVAAAMTFTLPLSPTVSGRFKTSAPRLTPPQTKADPRHPLMTAGSSFHQTGKGLVKRTSSSLNALMMILS